LWWIKKKDELLNIASKTSNCIIYDTFTIENSIKKLKKIEAIDQLFFAMKANFNSEILDIIYKSGLGFECVSIGEMKRLFDLIPNIDRKKIIFTPNFAKKSDYIWALANQVIVIVDSIYPIAKWPDIFENKDIMIRIDPGKGDGHHDHVITAGSHSKFGIPLSDINQVLRLCEKYRIKIIGLHTHHGSGIKNISTWIDTAKLLLELSKKFKDTAVINLGGGIPIKEKLNQREFDFNKFSQMLIDLKKNFKNIAMWFEPGRFIVGESGALITRVTQIKQKDDQKYIGVDVGMNVLIRPILYGSYHEIVNLTKYDQERKLLVSIVGPICESGDKLGENREFPETDEEDVILIANAGAYVRSMASEYNLREMPDEIII
tara:strand:+ start:2990 stop:4114 length:1125 start_codon:yes stop_codon:yes gene_type:complete